MRALVVEDNPVLMRCTEQQLITLGIVVHRAFDGLEALRAYKQHKFQLILMDINMPIMNGFEATGQIRDFEKTNDLSHSVIVAYSSDSILSSDFDYCSHGFSSTLTKPATLVELRALLASLVDIKKAV